MLYMHCTLSLFVLELGLINLRQNFKFCHTIAGNLRSVRHASVGIN